MFMKTILAKTLKSKFCNSLDWDAETADRCTNNYLIGAHEVVLIYDIQRLEGNKERISFLFNCRRFVYETEKPHLLKFWIKELF
jgi:hypothetical protein